MNGFDGSKWFERSHTAEVLLYSKPDSSINTLPPYFKVWATIVVMVQSFKTLEPCFLYPKNDRRRV